RRVSNGRRVAAPEPADVIADARRDRSRTAALNGVEEVVIVGDLHRLSTHARIPRRGIHVDHPRRDGDRPEEPVGLNARVPVVDLLRLATGGRLEEVNSDEPERSLTYVAVGVEVRSLHETHVRVEGVGGPVAPACRALDLRRAD